MIGGWRLKSARVWPAAATVTWDSGAEQGLRSSPLCEMCWGNRNHRCQTLWHGLKAGLIKPPQTSRTMESPLSPGEILRHATGGERRGGSDAIRALLSLWKEATQVLLTQGLLPEIAFWPTWLSGIWNEPLMDTEVILCPCGPFIAFKLSCLYSSPPRPRLFFLSPSTLFVHKSFFWCISSQVL